MDNLSPQEAQKRVLAIAAPLPVQNVPLVDALQRALSADVRAPGDNPPFTHSAMDGWAVRATDAATQDALLKIQETIPAGATTTVELAQGHAARIFTGAPLPKGADCVVMQEHSSIEGRSVRLKEPAVAGGFVRYRGEDIRRGEPVLHAGHVLQAGDIGLLASLGVRDVAVFQKPSVAVCTNGNELKDLHETLGHGEIYNSNRWLLTALLQEARATCVILPNISDTFDTVCNALATAKEQSDLVVTVGGVSVGDHDLVKKAVAAMGQVDFWGVAMKPGKPMAAGRIGDTPWIGLPGNPASAFVGFAMFVAPALRRMAGHATPAFAAVPVLLGAAVKAPVSRDEFMRAAVHVAGDGTVWAIPKGSQESGRHTSLRRTQCLVQIEKGSGDVARGTLVQAHFLQPFFAT